MNPSNADLLKIVQDLQKRVADLERDNTPILHTHNGFDTNKIAFSDLTKDGIGAFSVPFGVLMRYKSLTKFFDIYGARAEPGEDALYIDAVTANSGAIRVGGLVKPDEFTADAKTTIELTVNSATALAITATTAAFTAGASFVLTLPSASKLAGLGTGANGLVLKNLKSSDHTTLSGAALDIEIDIGGTPYYFAVSPNKTGL